MANTRPLVRTISVSYRDYGCGQSARRTYTLTASYGPDVPPHKIMTSSTAWILAQLTKFGASNTIARMVTAWAGTVHRDPETREVTVDPKTTANWELDSRQ
jgi:hypothetical protein